MTSTQSNSMQTLVPDTTVDISMQANMEQPSELSVLKRRLEQIEADMHSLIEKIVRRVGHL